MRNYISLTMSALLLVSGLAHANMFGGKIDTDAAFEQMQKYQPEQTDDVAPTPLVDAFIAKDFDKVKKMLNDGANPDEANAAGMTVLMLSSYVNQKDIVTLLLEKGADVNLKDISQRPAIIYASIGGDADIVKMLIDKGADVNAVSDEDESSLFFAAGDRKSVV